MAEKEVEFLAEASEMLKNVADPDTEEQEFLDRLWSFGEGYFDFTTFAEVFGESGEISSDRA